MTKKINEFSIEQYAIDLLEKQGYSYIYSPNIAPDNGTPTRQSFEEVLLPDKLKTSIARNILADTIPDVTITNYRVFPGSSTNESKL